MRKFALYRDPPDFDDQLGTCLPLNGPHTFLVDPAGLGLNVNPEISGFDNFFYKKIKKSSFDPETVSGTIIFYDEQNPKNAYFYYRQFVSFCTHAKNLYFGYAPFANDDPDDLSEAFVTYTTNGITFRPNVENLVTFENDGIYIASGAQDVSMESTIYKANAEFVSIDKSEIDVYGTLQCPVQFTLLTPWYDDHHLMISDLPPGRFADIDYTIPQPSDDRLNIGIIEGDLPGSISINIRPAPGYENFWFVWLSVKVINQETGETLQTISFSTTDIYGDTADPYEPIECKEFEYSSEYQNSRFHAKVKRGNETEYQDVNLIDYIDILSDVYKKIPISTPVKLNIQSYSGTASSTFKLEINYKLFDYYRSV